MNERTILNDAQRTEALYQALKKKYAPHTYQSNPKTVVAIQLLPENFAEIEKVFGCKIRGDDGLSDLLNIDFGWRDKIASVLKWVVLDGKNISVLSDADFQEEFQICTKDYQ